MKFYHIRNKWFLMTDGTEGSIAVIPLQDSKGNPVTPGPSTPAPVPYSGPEQKAGEEPTWDIAQLSETLDKMNAMISENSAQIRALSVAQSEGLQRMQEINETNSTQIKALAQNQTKLQSMIDQNASHYIALSNSSFSSQEQLRSVLQTNAEQIHALSESQNKMAATSSTLLNSIEVLGSTVARVGDIGASRRGWSAGEVGQLPQVPPLIAPPPRKLNRRIKSVWYEYDGSLSGSRRTGVDFLQTEIKSHVSRE